MKTQSREGTLILGASGLIGKYTFELLKIEKKVIGTYNSNYKPGLLYFDLKNPNINSLEVKGFKYAIICSALTKLDKCKNDPQLSNEINVDGMKKTIEQIVQNNIVPVYFSSASVFDGKTGGYREEDKKNPISLYGRQKAEIEDFIIKNCKDYLIIRPGKAYGTNPGEGVLFTEWLNKYNKKEKILCATDERLSPTYAEDIALGVKILLEKECRGIYHLNNPENYSRYEMAKCFFDYLNIKDVNLVACSINDFNFSEKRMMRSYLDTTKFLKETEMKYTEISKTFDKIFKGQENIIKLK